MDEQKIISDAKEKYDKMYSLSLKVTDDYTSARRSDVEQIRNVLLSISTISFGAVGFSIPIIGSSSVIKNPVLFSIGLFFLSISAVTGLWYSAIGIENSILGSFEGFKKNKKKLTKQWGMSFF